jgi:hypothetical protein
MFDDGRSKEKTGNANNNKTQHTHQRVGKDEKISIVFLEMSPIYDA